MTVGSTTELGGRVELKEGTNNTKWQRNVPSAAHLNVRLIFRIENIFVGCLAVDESVSHDGLCRQWGGWTERNAPKKGRETSNLNVLLTLHIDEM